MKPATLAALLLAAAAPVHAQDAQPRVHLAASGLYQALFDSFNKVSTFQLFNEEGRFSTAYPPAKSPALAGSAAVRLWRSIGVGGIVTRMDSTTDASIAGEVPHPFFFDRNRPIAGTAEAIERRETGIHVHLTLIIPVTPRFDLSLFAGPSRWQVRQDRITSLDYTSQYPFDTARLSGVIVEEINESTWGYNAGVDFALYFSRHVGAGALLLLATANPDTAVTTTTADTRIGGMRLGGGLRLRF